jgi:hypothetical protein
MKIRNGFVSNSSSSSFIVAFSTLPKSVEELQAALFGSEKVYPNPYIYGNKDPYGWPAEEVAATVWKDLMMERYKVLAEGADNSWDTPTGVISREEAVKIGLSGYLDDAEYPQYPNYDISSSEKRMKNWNEYEKQRNQADKVVVDSFLSTVPEEYVLAHFEYSDNDGAYFTALEHGPLFMKVKSLRISHH